MKSRTLRILDYNSNCLSFDLKDIISECKHYDGHRWVAWDVECDSSNWYETFSEATNQQVEMSFNELIDYAENVGQTIDGFFLAIKPNLKKIPIINEDLDLRDIADLIIKSAMSLKSRSSLIMGIFFKFGFMARKKPSIVWPTFSA